MAVSYSEMYQAYERYVPELTHEDVQRRDDEHLGLTGLEEMRATLALISQPGYRLDDGALRTCEVCAGTMLRTHFHTARETA